MRKASNVVRVGFVLAVLSVVACSRDPAAGALGAPCARAAASAQRFAGPHGSRSVLDQRAEPGGSEVLTGDTEIATGAASVRRVRETARLDSRGNLVRGEIAIEGVSGAVVTERVTMDVPTGTVEVWRAGTGTTVERVANDAPWAYAPSDGGALVSTPLAAWIAFRAARTSAVVRVVRPDATGDPMSYLAPTDQLALPTEAGTTVVLNHDGIDVSGEFVESVRLLDLGVTLTRGPDPTGPGS
jgi:hypothetical protein